LPGQRISAGDKNVVAIATVAREVGCHGNGFLPETKMWLPLQSVLGHTAFIDRNNLVFETRNIAFIPLIPKENILHSSHYFGL
jgi:hypothetical protein